jgi:hypothetical protein
MTRPGRRPVGRISISARGGSLRCGCWSGRSSAWNRAHVHPLSHHQAGAPVSSGAFAKEDRTSAGWPLRDRSGKIRPASTSALMRLTVATRGGCRSRRTRSAARARPVPQVPVDEVLDDVLRGDVGDLLGERLQRQREEVGERRAERPRARLRAEVQEVREHRAGDLLVVVADRRVGVGERAVDADGGRASRRSGRRARVLAGPPRRARARARR